MKAHPDDQRKLLTVQDFDNQVNVLNKTLASLPEQAERDAVSEQLKELTQQLVTAQGELEDAQRDLTRIDDDVKVVEQRIIVDKERENSSASARDVQALEAELHSLAKRKDVLEEAELEAMQIVEDKEKALAEITRQRDELEAHKQSLTDRITERSADLQAQVEQISADRAVLVSSLPQELMDLYERQRARYGIGAALLTRRISGASGVELTSTDLDKIRAADPDDVILCPDSSCILIRTEESGLS